MYILYANVIVFLEFISWVLLGIVTNRWKSLSTFNNFNCSILDWKISETQKECMAIKLQS